LSAGGVTRPPSSAGRGRRPPAWGPEHRRAAVAVTFDNLGEATDLERGLWPLDEPLGHHFSVTHALPRVLALLSELQLRATFFVEGLNAELYPDALRAIDAAGHEVGYHGWRHEPWAGLGSQRERELLERGAGALGRLGLRPVGFRPPGGATAASSWRALAECGFAYCSPAGDGAGVRDGLAVLPFRWGLIDAFHYLPNFAERRRTALGAPDVLPPARLRDTLAQALADAVGRGAFLATVFHPFLADADDRLEALRAVLGDVRALVDEGWVWCAPLGDIAAWVREQPDAGAWELVLDEK
jgi:peptidoglycan/xylan/chitin deacetylase (PgdA/CDA1 family)